MLWKCISFLITGITRDYLVLGAALWFKAEAFTQTHVAFWPVPGKNWSHSQTSWTLGTTIFKATEKTRQVIMSVFPIHGVQILLIHYLGQETTCGSHLNLNECLFKTAVLKFWNVWEQVSWTTEEGDGY